MMEGDVVRITLDLTAEMDFRFQASISIGSCNLWSTSDLYGINALKVYSGDTRFSIDIPISELAGRTTLAMRLSTRAPSLDGSNPDAMNKVSITLGIPLMLERLAAFTPNFPPEALAGRTAVTSLISLDHTVRYANDTGTPSSGFTFHSLSAQVFSDNTVTFILSFSTERVFQVGIVTSYDDTGYGTFGPGTQSWAVSYPFYQLSSSYGITYQFHEVDNPANSGFLHVSGDTLGALMEQKTTGSEDPALSPGTVVNRTPLTAPLILDCSVNYVSVDGSPTTGFTAHSLSGQVFSDDTVTFVLTFSAADAFYISAFEPPNGQSFAQLSVSPEETSCTFTISASALADIKEFTVKFYSVQNFSNSGYLHIRGDNLRRSLSL